MDDLKLLARNIAQQAMSYPFKIWGFGEGIALRALWQAAPLLNEPGYLEWVIGLLEAWLQRKPILQEADHSAPGFLLLSAYELVGDKRYLQLVLDLAAQMKQLPHDASGATFHRPQHPDFHHYIYVDCMEVDAPFFCYLAQVTGDKSYSDWGAAQLLDYCQLLQDERTGFFYHQYDGTTGQVNGAFWGRGNGWALVGMIETLQLLPQTHPAWEKIFLHFKFLVDALISCQHPTGEWSTVLDQPETYAEGSLPAMFYYGLAHSDRLQLYPIEENVLESTWQALRKHISPDGILQGVSIATPPGDAAHYAQIRRGGVYPWGQGPALLACLERLELQDRT